MKWPELMILIRHDTSIYNALKERKNKSSLYQAFLKSFSRDPNSEETVRLAKEVQAEFSLGVGDSNTPLLDNEATRAKKVGIALRKKYGPTKPHIIFVSPYQRTLMTLAGIIQGWPELRFTKVVEDERIREQEHGLSLIYNDWRVFHTLHPDQRRLYEIEGSYWYRYPQGENVPDVRERNRSWINTVVRDFSEKRILAVTHHLNILALRANLERWGAEEFMETDNEDKPINCGVTTYRGHPEEGKDGRFKLESYNAKMF